VTYDSLGSTYANALRCMRIVQAKFRAGRSTRGDVARWIKEETGCSLATSYRHAAACIDVLMLDVAEEARALRGERNAVLRSQYVQESDGSL